MNTRQFLSPNLKFNNDLIYYLHFNELNNEKYKEDNYFIHLEDDIKENTITINSNKIYYKIILSLFDDSVVIEMKYDVELSKFGENLFCNTNDASLVINDWLTDCTAVINDDS